MKRLWLFLLPLLLLTPTAQAADVTLPARGCFYYPWFPETWTVGGQHVFYHPTLGYYDSADTQVIDTHADALQRSRCQVPILSWWGPNTHSEQVRIPLILNRWWSVSWGWLNPTLYYEKESTGNPTVSQLQADLAYASVYANHSRYAWVNGKPSIFVYTDNETNICDVATRWKQAAPGWYVNIKLSTGFASCADQPDAWHQYGPSTAYQEHAGHYTNISPGFWRADEATPRLARDLTRWKQNIRDMLASNQPWQLFTSFNEWGEGTAVEHATEWNLPQPHGPYIEALLANGVESNPTIAAAGDIANPCSGSPPSGAQATSDLLVNQGLAAVLGLGDLQYESGELTNFNNCYEPTWGRVKSITKPAPGNHEYQTSGASGYFSYFPGTPSYYAFDIGTWRLYSLNSEISMSAGSTQEQWLRNDLAANPRSCVLAYWHKPLFSSGNYRPGISSTRPVFQALYDAGAEVALVGHDHLYERFAPQSPTGVADPNGIRQITVGTGGRSHYSFGTPIANSEVRNATTYGVLKMTLRSGSYSWQFVPVAGSIFTDSGSGTCT